MTYRREFFVECIYSEFTFLALGPSGLVPIMVSLKQSGFYIVPSLPIIAISFVLFLNFSFSNTIQRDHALLQDVHKIIAKVPKYSTIYILKIYIKTGPSKDTFKDIITLAKVIRVQHCTHICSLKNQILVR